MDKKVSVIVPVYKVEQYLPQCLDSIISQTYSDLEIILVDDGSPDRCGEICDQYAERDSRIAVYHIPNGGVSNARNYGMRVATGEYISFVDSDDYIQPNYIQDMYAKMESGQYDIVFCKMNRYIDGALEPVYERALVDQEFSCPEQFYTNFFATTATHSTIMGSMWRTLYRKDIIDKYHIAVEKDIKYAEDMCFLLDYAYHTSRVGVVDEHLYNYRSVSDSATRAYYDLCPQVDLLYAKLSTLIHSEDFLRQVRVQYMYTLFYRELEQNPDYNKANIKRLRKHRFYADFNLKTWYRSPSRSKRVLVYILAIKWHIYGIIHARYLHIISNK